MSLSEAKFQQLNRAGTTRIYGQPIKAELDGDLKSGVAARRRWKPMHPCLCTHDNPNNPCPCMEGDFWWILGDSIVAEGESDRKGHDGKPLYYYDVLVDSKIMVESMQSVRAGDLKTSGCGGATSAAALRPENIFDDLFKNDDLLKKILEGLRSTGPTFPTDSGGTTGTAYMLPLGPIAGWIIKRIIIRVIAGLIIKAVEEAVDALSKEQPQGKPQAPSADAIRDLVNSLGQGGGVSGGGTMASPGLDILVEKLAAALREWLLKQSQEKRQ